MTINHNNFIVLDNVTTKEIRTKVLGSMCEYRYSFMGHQIFPINVSIPVIEKGSRAVGIAMVKSIHLYEDHTEIVFQMRNPEKKRLQDEKLLESMFSLYQMQNSSAAKTGSDIYENTDEIVPGVFQPNAGISASRSEEDYDDDDDDDGMSLSDLFRGGKW